jgi:SAM-dependent MidA family methyltransferase
MQTVDPLPRPTTDALAHSRRLVAHIQRQIRDRGGWIEFQEFMDLALYAPGLGYYSAGTRKFGQAGDFTTAPEISPLFAGCIAHAAADVMSACDGGVILELGGGTGALAAELLRALARLERLPEQYLILEISADLRDRQRELVTTRVPEYARRVAWLDRLPDDRLNGLILANEVMDALPVCRFRIGKGGPLSVGVVNHERSFDWAARSASPALCEAVRGVERDLGQPLPVGYESEICLAIAPWIAGLSACLARGVILLADYGLPRREYYHAERLGGTLMCHYRHRAHQDPFFMPGLQDISAWVDFTRVAEAADQAGLSVLGYTTQAHFLLASGLAEEVQRVAPADAPGQVELAAAVRRLTMPGEMGEYFKLLALGRRRAKAPPGFAGRDLRHLL